MRTHALRATLLLSLAATGSAQSLPWTITTESTRVTTAPFGSVQPSYLEHARPAQLRPFVRIGPIPGVYGEATLSVVMDWSIDVAHTGVTPLSFDPQVLRHAPTSPTGTAGAGHSRSRATCRSAPSSSARR